MEIIEIKNPDGSISVTKTGKICEFFYECDHLKENEKEQLSKRITDFWDEVINLSEKVKPFQVERLSGKTQKWEAIV